MEDEAAEKLVPRHSGQRTVSLRCFLITIVCFLAALVVLGLGLGLGLGLPMASLASFRAKTESGRIERYGLPDSLETIEIEHLVNRTDLNMRTGFAKTNGGGNAGGGNSTKREENKAAVREYEFNITQAYAAPDGFYKPMILVNGQSPGPLVEANNGDTIRVRVNNQMINSSTSVHWHGIDQKNTTWMDGVMGVTQCGIPPGENFTYEFQIVDQRGTFWYHAHAAVQYSDGLYGPIVIHDSEEMVPRYDDEKILFLGDHYHTFAPILVASYLTSTSAWTPTEPGVEPLPDNFLINGQHTTNCTAISTTFNASSSSILPAMSPDAPPCTPGQLYTTTVRPNSTTRIRLISHASFMSFWFSIDNHTLSIVEIDGVEVEPISARGVYVNIGQRYSVLVTANQTAAEGESFYMRATLPQTCFRPYAPYNNTALDSTGYEAKAVLTYGDPEKSVSAAGGEGGELKIVGAAENTSNPYGVENNGVRGDVWEGCDDMPFDMPMPMRKIKAIEAATENSYAVLFQFRQVGEVNRIFINRTSWAAYADDTQLFQALDQNFTEGKGGSYNNWDFRLDQQVLLLPSGGKGVQIAINSMDIMEHPFHMHFQIVGWGHGQFDPSSNNTKTTWNLDNPMRRDTMTMPAQTHAVIRFEADNPGIWALHCHVAWHMEAGMFVSFLERPTDLKTLVGNMDAATREKAEGFCAARTNATTAAGR